MIAHAFAQTDEYALLPLCYEHGEEWPLPTMSGEGMMLTPLLGSMTCPECLEWIHA